MAIVVDLDVELVKRRMSLIELSARVDITTANLSVLKNGRAKAVRLSTLDALCEALGCQPGDLLRHVPDDQVDDRPARLAAGTDADE